MAGTVPSPCWSWSRTWCSAGAVQDGGHGISIGRCSAPWRGRAVRALVTSPTVELDPRRWRALGVMLMGQFCALLDVSVTNVALPSIGRSTGAGPAELQWVVSGYILAFGLMPVIGGRLGDARGRRRVFIIGVTGFVAASAAVGLAPSAGVLIGVRVVQGLFGGVIGPQVSGFIQNTFPRAERGRAFGRLGLTVGVGTALGPVIGGLLIAAGGPEFGWRLVFFINVPIGLLAVVLARLWVSAPPLDRSASHAARRRGSVPARGRAAAGPLPDRRGQRVP